MSQLLGSKTYVTSDGSVPVLGVTDGSNAPAGYVGEVISSAIIAPVSYTSSSQTNIASITLTAGDWDVSGVGVLSLAGSTTSSNFQVGISLTSSTIPSTQSGNTTYVTGIATGSGSSVPTPSVRVSVATTTIVYLVGFCVFAVSTASMGGFIRARRIR